MIWNGITVCLSAAAGAVGLFYGFTYGGLLLLVGIGRVQDWTLRKRKPLYRHTCSVCSRVQHWREPFDQWSPCRACQIADEKKPLEINFDDFASAVELAAYLNGAEVVSAEVQPTVQ